MKCPIPKNVKSKKFSGLLWMKIIKMFAGNITHQTSLITVHWFITFLWVISVFEDFDQLLINEGWNYYWMKVEGLTNILFTIQIKKFKQCFYSTLRRTMGWEITVNVSIIKYEFFHYFFLVFVWMLEDFEI